MRGRSALVLACGLMLAACGDDDNDDDSGQRLPDDSGDEGLGNDATGAPGATGTGTGAGTGGGTGSGTGGGTGGGTGAGTGSTTTAPTTSGSTTTWTPTEDPNCPRDTVDLYGICTCQDMCKNPGTCFLNTTTNTGFCAASCQTTAHCPPAPEGITATPACMVGGSVSNLCVLACAGGGTCPAGLVCQPLGGQDICL